jgi:hypothetical protein
VYHIKEATTINYVAISMARIYATMQNLQENHPDLVVELEGIIAKQLVSILIELGPNLN